MGSWYKTCGLSNLHITDNTDVMVFVLAKSTDPTDRCYSTAFWKPCLMPFYAKYADYGRGDEDTGVALPYIMEAIKQELIEMELGDNEYHDIAVKKDEFDIELFYEAVHEGRLFKKDFRGNPQMLDFVMVRKDIVDDILTNFTIELFMGEGKGDDGGYYRKVNFQTILADLPGYMEELKKRFTPAENEDDFQKYHRLSNFIGDGTLFDYDHPNLVNKWLRFDNFRFGALMHMGDLIRNTAKNNQWDKTEELIVDLLKGIYIDCLMECTRKNWSPGGHEGSQSREDQGYRALSQAVLAAIDRERAEYEEENEVD